jgi:hypothetical protein
MKIKLTLLGLLLCLAQSVLAQVVANVTHLSGLLSVQRADGSKKVLALKSEVLQGDLLSTSADTYARLKFTDASELVLRPGTQLRVDRVSYDVAKPEADSLSLSLLKGGMRAVSGLIGKRSKESVQYTTPTATIGIRGTHFGVLYCEDNCSDIATVNGTVPPNGLHVDVAQGAVELKNAAGSLVVNTGEFSFVLNSTTAPVTVPPDQGVQVTMPTSISQNKSTDVAGLVKTSGGSSAGGAGGNECTAQ